MMKEVKKSRTIPFLITLLILLAGLSAASQETSPQNGPEEPAPESLYVRLTFYPTASLSRYDYNNDVDHYEVRAYEKINDLSLTLGTYESIKKEALDPYLFIRDAYIQYRQNKVKH